jgi:hypothetical protein
VERGPVLTAIEDALAAGGPVVLRAADGRAGLGVMTAMIQFAHRYRDAYDVAWWITAQDPQLIADQMARLAQTLGVDAPSNTAEEATSAALAGCAGGVGGCWSSTTRAAATTSPGFSARGGGPCPRRLRGPGLAGAGR